MTISLSASNTDWLKSHINQDVTENTTFIMKIGAVIPEGIKEVEVEVDLIWFIILHITDKSDSKLNTALELLKNPFLLQRFKKTLMSESVKPIIAEFLIFNHSYLNVLKDYIDFSLLNMPLDFISYSLFIKRSEDRDTQAINLERLKIVNAVLDTNFKLDPNNIDENQSSVLAKVLLMEDVTNKFEVALKLFAAGYPLFNSNPINDSSCAVRLIDARMINEAQELIKQNSQHFKNVRLRVPGNDGELGNLADYYYWIKEDLNALRYIKDNFGIELTPSA